MRKRTFIELSPGGSPGMQAIDPPLFGLSISKMSGADPFALPAARAILAFRLELLR